MSLILAADNPLNHVVQHTLWDLNPDGGPWFMVPIVSNHIIMQVVGALLLLWWLPRAVMKTAGTDEINRHVPRGAANALEVICFGLRDRIFEPNLGRHTNRFTPLLWSYFFFILISNLLGMLPLSDWFYFVPGHLIGGTSTGNIWVTGAMAVSSLVLIVYNGLRFNGMDYIKHFFMGPSFLAWFIALLEMAGMLFKTMALAVRLFANMLAGHILLAVLVSFANLGTTIGQILSPVVVLACVLFNFLEIFVAFLHAFIFTALTAVFLGMAVNIHHDDEHEHEHA